MQHPLFTKNNLTAGAFCLALFIPNLSSATNLTNGDFSSGDFSGWSQDIDGLGEPLAGLNDFSLEESPMGEYAAHIETDFWSTAGDTGSTPRNEAFFASTLYQGLDLTASAGQNITLSFDWSFTGEESAFDENFIVGLGDGSGNYHGADGTLGFLLNPMEYGSGTYSATLNTALNNTTGWALEFQLNTGFDGYGSKIVIDNVSLSTVSAVPVPAAVWLMGSALAGLIGFQRKNQA